MKTFIKVIIACFIVSFAYMAYFFLIGVPKTQARTYYNFGMDELERGNKAKAIEDFQKALSFWNEGYIQDKLKSITN